MPSPSTPAALGYRMPAEWEPHAATWLAWPHRRATWPGKFEPVPAVWAEFARVLAQSEPVQVLAGGPVMDEAARMIAGAAGITLHDIPTNDVWARDYGPTFLAGPAGLPPALVDWNFNSWGGKYPPFDHDDDVPRRIAEWQGRRRFQPGIVLEGGSIDTNGQGTVLTTEQCLLNPNRNPQLDRRQLEEYLAEYLGFRHVLWLGEGIVGDDTDGHVDDLTRFVNPTTVVTIVEDNPSEANYGPLRDNLRRLRTMTDQSGRPLDVVPLPMPRPVFFDSKQLPASYANFYISNRTVVVPIFHDPADAVALDILRRLFPTRQVHGLYAVDLVLGKGCFHCISQQEPAV